MKPPEERTASRRQAIALGLTAVAGLGIGWIARTPEAGRLNLQLLGSKRDLDELEHKPVSYGGGVSLLGPFPGTKGGEVMLRSIFAFSPNSVICTVEDNPEGFIFPTATMGNVPLEPHSFFMYMGGSKVEKVEYSKEGDHMKVEIHGGLNCHTEALTASGKFGGRNYSEPAEFEAVAVDDEDFEITVSFDKDKAPVNSAIFGPKFTFKGKIAEANITVASVEHITTSAEGGGGHKEGGGG